MLDTTDRGMGSDRGDQQIGEGGVLPPVEDQPFTWRQAQSALQELGRALQLASSVRTDISKDDWPENGVQTAGQFKLAVESFLAPFVGEAQDILRAVAGELDSRDMEIPVSPEALRDLDIERATASRTSFTHAVEPFNARLSKAAKGLTTACVTIRDRLHEFRTGLADVCNNYTKVGLVLSDVKRSGAAQPAVRAIAELVLAHGKEQLLRKVRGALSATHVQEGETTSSAGLNAASTVAVDQRIAQMLTDSLEELARAGRDVVEANRQGVFSPQSSPVLFLATAHITQFANEARLQAVKPAVSVEEIANRALELKTKTAAFSAAVTQYCRDVSTLSTSNLNQ